ncbi:hypothetical protein CAG99_19020 [Streptomyces marincola]|uniref:Uncharacterized protein n=1 Tax=Streptomyces marincola TaxID=2878388 RepID=A0A1W7D7A7_9ACTN|nr:hypothetical protein [Streptomyces marincola]ARQ72480.1 hypothetical protein CAG99_19020 [Streptomyces marincola]
MLVTECPDACDKKDCPTLYATDRGTLLVRGDLTDEHKLELPAHEGVVEIQLSLIKKAIARGHL